MHHLFTFSKIRFGLCLFFLLVSSSLYSANELTLEKDSVNVYKTILTDQETISYRKDTIQKYWGNICGKEFLTQIDNLVLYINRLQTDLKTKSKYTSYLKDFLVSIENPNANLYFTSGRYLSVLKYYPAIIDYNESNRLEELLSTDKLLSLKAIRLFKNEKAAEPFLKSFSEENPDEVFRNVNEFSDKSYASSIVLYCAGLAPLSAERYLGGFNSVNRIIKTSDYYLANTLTRMDSVKTARHNRFLFLDYYMRDTFPSFDLTSIQNNKILFFKELVSLHFRKGVWGKYSIDRELSILSSDIIREINYYYSNGYKNNVQSILASFSPEELYLIFIYGYQDASIYSFNSYIELLKYKSTKKFDASFYETISNADLTSFLSVAEKFDKTSDILSLTSDNYKNSILKNLTITEDNTSISYDRYLDNFLKTETVTSSIITSKSKVEPLTSSNITKETTTELEDKNVKTLDRNYTLNENKINTDTKSNIDVSLLKNSQVSLLEEEELNLSKKDELAIDEITLKSSLSKTIIPPVVIRVSAEERTTYELLKNLDENLGNINFVNSFIDKKYAHNVLSTIASSHPEMIFKYTKNLQSKFWIKDLLECAARQSPSCYKRYLPNEAHPVNWILQHSQDSMVLEMNTMYKTLGYKSNAYNLIDDVLCKRKNLDDCNLIAQDAEMNFKEMSNIVLGNDKAIGKNSLESELQNASLLKVRKINDINDVSDEVRFASIKDYSPELLYILMVYGEDELFKNSFSGLFQRLISKIPENGGYQFLQKINFLHFRTFLKICGNFGKTEVFLNKMSPDERLLLIGKMTKGLELEKYNPSEVIFVAEAIPGFTNMNDRAVINTSIKSEFERLQKNNDGTGMLLYGLLATIIQKDVVAEKDWFQQISTSFELPIIDRLKISSLINENHICVQQHYFYDDDDGRSSFSNFVASFKAMPNYIIENHESYIQITSSGGVNKILIFANKPEYEQNGINEIQKYLKLNNLEPTVVVHRGHSFHTEKTLNVISANTKLLVVGSCGGYYKLPIAIERAPEAHIVSTKQIGTMRVNDPIIKMLCEKIRLNQDIIWSDFWKEVEIAVGKTPMFYDYVAPNKNLGSLFLNAYYKAIDLASLKEPN